MKKKVATLTLLALLLTGCSYHPDCFEDEAVVILYETWTGTHHEIARDTGNLYCAPVDDLRN